jgi:hypothetical protein
MHSFDDVRRYPQRDIASLTWVSPCDEKDARLVFENVANLVGA